MTNTLTALIPLCLIASLACSSDDSKPDPSVANTFVIDTPDPEVVRYLMDNFGTQIERLDGLDTFTVDATGDAVTTGELRIDVTGFGSREIYLEETLSSASKGGHVLLYLEDLDSGDARFFDFDPGENYIAFGQDLLDPSEEGFKERGAAVSRQDDGRYVVWTFSDGSERENEQVVDDGYAALRIVEQYTEFSTIPPHILMAAVSFGHTPVPEARSPMSCIDTAVRAPICTVFKEFCDCAACVVLDRGGDCDLCPEL